MTENSYHIHISAKRKRINLNFRELWAYRDLIFLFVNRDFTSLYKQTLLGPLWAVIRPLLTTVVFTIVFGNLANLTTLDIATEGDVRVPGFLFYMAGTICWSYFSSVFTASSQTFLTNRNIMGKVYFPRMVAPISSALSSMISYFIQLGVFFVIWLVYIIRGTTTMHLTPYVLLLPALIVQMMLLGIGAGIIISSLTTKYRDLVMLVSFLIQLLQFASPIAYGLALVPDRYLSVYLLNPITVIVTAFRCAFFGGGFFSGFYYGISWLITGVIFMIGMLMFNYVEKTFMDTI